MEKVELDGVAYVKASVVAKDFGYTADYIGQLCRGKKLDAKLVGRSWYVNPQSVEDHQNDKQTTKTETPESTDKPIESKTERVRVDPVIKNKTVKAIADKQSDFKVTKRHLIVNYEPDEESLMPKISRHTLPPKKTLHVEPANAKKLRVLGNKSNLRFETEDMPDFALSGKLSITEAEEPEKNTQDQDESTNETATNTDMPNTEHIKIKEVAGSRKSKVPFRLTKYSDKTSNINDISDRPDADAVESPRHSQRQPVNRSHSRAKTGHHPVKFTPASLATAEPVKINSFIIASPLIATVFAALVVSAIFASSSVTVVSQSSSQSALEIHAANLMNALNFKK